MKSKNNYFSVDYKTSQQKLWFNNIPAKFENHSLHYVMSSKRHEFFCTENVKYNHWYIRGDYIPLEFDYIKLYAFDLDSGVQLIDEYKFNITDFNIMFNFVTNDIDEANVWSKYVDLLNKSIGTRFKYVVNSNSNNESYDNYIISRESYNNVYGMSKNDLKNVPSLSIIKKLVVEL